MSLYCRNQIVICGDEYMQCEAITYKESMICDKCEINNLNQRINQLESALGDMLQVVNHLAKSDHPYTAHEHRDTPEHRFGLQIEVAAQTLERNKEILDTINKRGEE